MDTEHTILVNEALKRTPGHRNVRAALLSQSPKGSLEERIHWHTAITTHSEYEVAAQKVRIWDHDRFVVLTKDGKLIIGQIGSPIQEELISAVVDIAVAGDKLCALIAQDSAKRLAVVWSNPEDLDSSIDIPVDEKVRMIHITRDRVNVASRNHVFAYNLSGALIAKRRMSGTISCFGGRTDCLSFSVLDRGKLNRHRIDENLKTISFRKEAATLDACYGEVSVHAVRNTIVFQTNTTLAFDFPDVQSTWLDTDTGLFIFATSTYIGFYLF